MAWYRRAAELGDARGQLQFDAMAAESEAPEPKKPAPAAPPVEASTQTAVAAPPAAAPPAGFGVQLAAYRSRDGAVAAWEILRSAHGGLLGTIASGFIKTPLADGGVVYRLVVGRFETKPEAGALCARLKRRGIDCFVPRN